MRKTGWRLVPVQCSPWLARLGDRAVGACLAVASAPLPYRGITSQWPEVLSRSQPDSTTTTLIKDRYRHCKPILTLASDQLLTAYGIDPALPDGQPDPGVITMADPSTAADPFVAAIAKHRHSHTKPLRRACETRRGSTDHHEERRRG
jgi:C-terminal domain found in long catalases